MDKSNPKKKEGSCENEERCFTSWREKPLLIALRKTLGLDLMVININEMKDHDSCSDEDMRRSGLLCPA